MAVNTSLKEPAREIAGRKQRFWIRSGFHPGWQRPYFAEMNLEEKNKFSHRKKATALLDRFFFFFYGKD